MTFDVTILGSNSAIPAHGRHPTAQVLNHNEKLFLLDCGEGTQVRLSNFKIKRSRIDHIFISHLHGDHYYGLIGLLTSYHLQQRSDELHIHCPVGLKEIIELNFRYSDTRLRYPLFYHEYPADKPRLIYENDDLQVTTIIMDHRIPTCGFLFAEKDRKRKILPEQLALHRIPVTAAADLKLGADFKADGKVIPNAELTGDPQPPLSYAFCADSLYKEANCEQLYGVDLLYHEATFMNESVARAAETYHSTTLQAAAIARKAAAGRLLIGHFSAKYADLEPLLNEARTIFPNTYLATEGEKFSVRKLVEHTT